MGSGNAYYTQGGDHAYLVMKNNIINGTVTAAGAKTYNIYSGSQSGLDTGELIVSDFSTLFVDYAGRDYHLKSGSPAIDAGTRVSGLKDDIESMGRPAGSANDIGPYEYGGTLEFRNVAEDAGITAFNVPNPLHYGAIHELGKAGFALELFTLDGVPVHAEQLRDGQMILVGYEGALQQVTVIR